MKSKVYLFIVMASLTMASCVSTKKLDAEKAKYNELSGNYLALQAKYRDLQDELKKCNNQVDKDNTMMAGMNNTKAGLEAQINDLNKQIDYLKSNNNTVLNQLKDLSVVTGSQAESIKKSLENIGSKDMYIRDLQGSIARKDSLNMALVMNLKGAIGNLDDKDINIKVDKGVVYVDISDKLLFKSASYDVTDRAKEVLGKVAKVLNNQPEIEFLVEGQRLAFRFQGFSQNSADIGLVAVEQRTDSERWVRAEVGDHLTRLLRMNKGFTRLLAQPCHDRDSVIAKHEQ